MIDKFIKHKKKDVVQYILVLTIIAIILAFAFPKIRDKMGATHNETINNVNVGLGNMFANSPENAPPQCVPLSPVVPYDVPLSVRQPYIDTYAYKYAIVAGIATGHQYRTARAYAYSNTPLNLTINNGGNMLSVKESSGKTFFGLNMWTNIFIDDYGYDNAVYTNPSSFSGTSFNWVYYRNVLHSTSQIISITDITGQSQGC